MTKCIWGKGVTQKFLISHHTHTHMFNGLFSRTVWVSRHQKGRPFWSKRWVAVASAGPCANHLYHTPDR